MLPAEAVRAGRRVHQRIHGSSASNLTIKNAARTLSELQEVDDDSLWIRAVNAYINAEANTIVQAMLAVTGPGDNVGVSSTRAPFPSEQHGSFSQVLACK